MRSLNLFITTPLACLGLLAGLALPAHAATGETEAHARIREAAQAAVLSALAGQGGRTRAVADRLDPRLRLPRCDQPLTARATSGPRPGARQSAEVSCRGSRPWKLYVNVRVTQVRPVVVAARPLARDGVLTAADVRLAERETAALGHGYIPSLEHALGQRLRRPLAEGEVLTPALLDAPVLVRRGQQVTLKAASGPLTVSMTGIASKDGVLGETIPVQNPRSGRAVDAVVRAAGLVEVRVP